WWHRKHFIGVTQPRKLSRPAPGGSRSVGNPHACATVHEPRAAGRAIAGPWTALRYELGTTRTAGGTAAMRSPLRLAGIGIASMGLVLLAGTAQAVEYRLFVASIYDTSFTSFVDVSELKYGASGPGLQRLETAISNGEIGWGDMPAGRAPPTVAPTLARAW